MRLLLLMMMMLFLKGRGIVSWLDSYFRSYTQALAWMKWLSMTRRANRFLWLIADHARSSEVAVQTFVTVSKRITPWLRLNVLLERIASDIA